MPVSAEVAAAVDVPEPPERVWRAAMDWDRQGEWMLATRVELTGGDGRSVGSTARAVTGLSGYGIADTFEVVEWAENGDRRCVVRHTGGVVRGLGIFEVVPRTGGSRFSWSERLRAAVRGAGHGWAGRWSGRRSRAGLQLVAAPVRPVLRQGTGDRADSADVRRGGWSGRTGWPAARGPVRRRSTWPTTTTSGAYRCTGWRRCSSG